MEDSDKSYLWALFQQISDLVPVMWNVGNMNCQMCCTSKSLYWETLQQSVCILILLTLLYRAWGEVTAESRSSRAEHPNTLATAEQRPSNITVSRERPQQQRRATTEPRGEQPRGCGGGRTSKAAMDSPQSIKYICL